MDSKEFDSVVKQIANSRKYRPMQIPRETIVDLLEKEILRHSKNSDAVKAVRAKLHNIAAPYLDELDYNQAMDSLEKIFSGTSNKSKREICTNLLNAHHSTHERMPYLSDFYEYIFEKIADDATILDLACGLNPFSLGLLDTLNSATWYAFDIHRPRIALIQRFFDGCGIQGSAICQDILIQPPTTKGTAAFLFKEIHRMEKRQAGASRDVINSLNISTLFISLPTRSINGNYDLRERMKRLVMRTIDGLGTFIEEKEFPAETIYLIQLNHD